MLHTKKTSQLLQRPVIVCFLALLCTALWAVRSPASRRDIAISHCLRGYGITAVICRRALFLSGDPCYFIWESSSEKSPAFPEISASQNWCCQSVPDDFAIRFLLHRTGTYHCSEKLYLWRDRCFVFDFVCLSDFSAGKADFLETCRLYSGFSGIFLISFQNLSELGFWLFVERRGRSFDLQYRQCVSPIS